jgi:hypothetical protein
VLSHLSAHSQAVLTGRTFFPRLITAPFRTGLHTAFGFAIAACLAAAAISLLRGGVYRYGDDLKLPLGADEPERPEPDVLAIH